MKIMLDAGHGKDTAGKRTPDGSMREYEFNRAVANHARELLNGYKDIEVLFAHSDALDVTLQERVKKANNSRADVYVSIHANAHMDEWSEANGIETYVYTSEPREAMQLAINVQNELLRETGRRNRGVKTANFFVLKYTNMTAILVECGFMTNKEEAGLLKTDEYRIKCARAIVRGLANQYKLVKKNSKVSLHVVLNDHSHSFEVDEDTATKAIKAFAEIGIQAEIRKGS